MALRKPDPDFWRLRRVLLRQGEPDRVPLIEFWCDREMMSAVLGEPIPGEWSSRQERERMLDGVVRFWYVAGYDYVCIGPRVALHGKLHAAEDTAILKHERRHWQDEGIGVISNWDEFERYTWPKPEEIDYYDVEYVASHLPDGMQVILSGDPAGQMEMLTALMGYTGLSFALHDDPSLVAAVADKAQELLTTIFATAAQIPGIGAMVLGDDMGFKTATMISPADLRRYVLPCQKRLAEISHAHGLPFLLHACGELSAIMDDLIGDVQIDGKHSFEDVILPVTEAKKRYGDRVALLGGIDMDVLSRACEDEVRSYTRAVIEACAPGGGWALGTGNTLANYIPVRNYLAMLETGWEVGRYH